MNKSFKQTVIFALALVAILSGVCLALDVLFNPLLWIIIGAALAVRYLEKPKSTRDQF